MEALPETLQTVFRGEDMTTELTIYKFKEYPIRITLDDKGAPWFVAKDVCDALGLKNVTKAIQNLPTDEKGLRKVSTSGGEQTVNIISEPGRYRLTMRCNKAQAKPFQDWIVKEAMPSIRKTGAYVAPTATGIETLQVLKILIDNQIVLEQRMDSYESKQQAVTAILAPVKEISTRSKISQVIREYANHHSKDYKACFQTLFYEFKYRYGTDLTQRTRNNGNKTIMDTAEECGCLDDLFALAVSLFVGK
jgi:prophage antirepressor-like protein